MNSEPWLDVCPADELEPDDVMRFDHGDNTFAVYRTEDDRYFATDGLCTHGRAHLSGGFVDGTTIECPKHNGRFDFTTGAAKSTPALIALGCYPARVVDGVVQIAVPPAVTTSAPDNPRAPQSSQR